MEWRQEQGPFPGDVNLAMVRTWTRWRTEVERRMGAQCARRDVRWRAWASLRGWLSPVERKNGWQVAEVNGETTPYGVQPLLGRALGDADALRDDVRPSVVEHLGAPQAVRVVEETGCLKKGQHATGVARQESGTAGRVANCPMGVWVTYASAQGHVGLDRALDLPQEWTNDTARCEGAGIPAERLLATKPPFAQQMLQRAFDAGVPAAWVAGERVYGDTRALRRWREEHHHAQVVAVSGKASVWHASRQPQVTSLVATLGAEGWSR